MQRIFCSPSTSSEGGHSASARILFTAIPLIAVAFAIVLMLSAPSNEDAQGAYEDQFTADCNGVDVLFTSFPGRLAYIGYHNFRTMSKDVTHLEVPSYVKNPKDGYRYKVVGVGDYAFSNDYMHGKKYNLNSIILPDTVTVIDYNAFDESKITSIVLPNSLKKIEEEAFLKCEKLESIHIPTSIEHIGSRVFKKCYHLAELTMPKHIEASGNTFDDSLHVRNITITDSDRPWYIQSGGTPWRNCVNDLSITFSEGIENIPGVCSTTCPD